jgi:SH3-like domain-containing protein
MMKEKLMPFVRKLAVVMIAMLSTLLLIAPVSAQDASAKLRFVHAIPGVSGLDIYVNDNLASVNLPFGEATAFINAPAGDLNVRVTLSGVTSTLWQQVVTSVAGDAKTLVASSTDPLAFDVYADDLSPIDLGTTRFMVIHAVKGGPAVDLQADGQTIITGLNYKDFLNTIDVPANTYTFAALASGAAADTAPVIAPTAIGLVGRTLQTVVVMGPATAPTALVLAAPVEVDAEVGTLRIIHSAEGAPNVDVEVNGALLAPNLAFGTGTVAIPVEPGTYTAAVRVAGGGSEIATLDVTIEAGVATTVAALGSLDNLAVDSFNSAIDAAQSPREVMATVINSIDGATVSLTGADGSVLAENLALGELNSSTFAPIRQGLTLTVQAGGAGETINVPIASFNGGAAYTLVTVRDAGGFTVKRFIDSRTQTINSAPGASDSLTQAATSTPEVAVATPVPVVEATAAAPTQPAAPVVTQSVAPNAPTQPTARVILDPGANLQLRQYPNAQALSLGLAPTGTVFVVNGREGAPIDILTNAVIALPDGTDWVDPAAALEQPTADLEPVDTWLNVTLTTADGTVTAWVNALYLDVRTPRGERQRLADLPTVPQNQPGDVTGTVVPTAAPPEDFARAIVFNLDAGVGLNIRRTADSSSEVLARIEIGTSSQLVGIGASGDWAFLEYSPPEGGTISGWASTLYLRYEFRGRSVTLDEAAALNLLNPVDEATQRGAVTAGAPGLVQPTQDPLRNSNVITVVGLNPGINLNLRRTPNVQAEVLANLPLGARALVFSRTNTNDWLEVEFDGARGWVAALYTTITFNERPVDIESLPVSTDFGNLPTPAPTATVTP